LEEAPPRDLPHYQVKSAEGQEISISLIDHSRQVLNSATSAKSMDFRVYKISLKPGPPPNNFFAARFISEFGNELAMEKFIHEVAA
jgi:hypothetical protein